MAGDTRTADSLLESFRGVLLGEDSPTDEPPPVFSFRMEKREEPL
jgi:hypothetical protein